MRAEIKTPPNYPPHPVSQRKPGIFQWIINRQSVQAPLRIRSGAYPGFCMIAVNPEDVAVIVVHVDAAWLYLFWKIVLWLDMSYGN